MNLESARELKRQVLADHVASLVTEAGARDIAVGIAPAGNGDYRLAVRLRRRSLVDSPAVERIVRAAAGEADVRVTGRGVKLTVPWYRQNCRPLNIGASVSHVDVAAGTIGGFARKRQGGGRYILSNNHVLANENAGAKGDPIVQRGLLDGGKDSADTVAKLDAFVALVATGANVVDCALAEVAADKDLDESTLRGLLGKARNGRLRGAAPAGSVRERITVRKLGRTTGATAGRITALELDNIVLNYGMGDIRFDDQVEIESTTKRVFADEGDSGSLIVDDGGLAVALLIGGSEDGGRNKQGVVWASPIGTVLDALRAELIV